MTIDSNILIYAIDHRSPGKAATAGRILEAVRASGAPLGLQVIAETFRVATRKLKWHPAMAERYLGGLLADLPTFSQTAETVSGAMSLAAAGRISIYDGTLVTAAELAGCTHLLSEDMHDGLRIGTVQIVNPFDGDGLSARARDLLSL